MADTGPRGPQGPAGTSIDLPVAIANGGTGATTAAGAKDALGIDGLTLRTLELPSLGSATIKFYSVANALIMCTGPSSSLYGSFVYNAYGTGGTQRAHIAELQKGSQLTYTINDESSDNSNGVTITNANTNTSNTCYVSVLVLRGGTPTITVS